MNPSEQDQALLDEKIALIRKNNEKLIKKKQAIDEEIQLAKKHNAMVDVSAPKTADDDKPTLYSDTIAKSIRKERNRSVPDKINYKPRNNVTKEDAAWKAERNEIDKERIRRQRAESGWRREWDADKHIPDHELLNDNFDRRGHSKENLSTRSSHNRGTERSELPVSNRQNQYRSKKSDAWVDRSELPLSARLNQYKNKQNDVSVERSELPASTRPDHNKSKPSDVSVERSESPVPRPNQFTNKPSDFSVDRSEKPVPRPTQSKGRGRPMVSADSSKITQTFRRTVNVEPPSVKHEKAPLKKRVSWGSENELIDSPRVSLKDDHLKNIKVQVNIVDSNAKKRSIEITEERGPLVKDKSEFKFDENTSFSIKDCVAKASLDKQSLKLQAIEDTAPPPKPKERSSVKVEPKPILVKSNSSVKRQPKVVSCVVAADQPLKEEVDPGDDEDWEELSDGSWESFSDEE